MSLLCVVSDAIFIYLLSLDGVAARWVEDLLAKLKLLCPVLCVFAKNGLLCFFFSE